METPGIDPRHLLIYTMDYKKDRAEENEKGVLWARSFLAVKTMRIRTKTGGGNMRQWRRRGKSKQGQANGGFSLDYSLVIIVFLLSMFGLLILYSATAYTDAAAHAGNSFYTAAKQAVFTAAALAVMFFVSRMDYHILVRYAKFAYPAAVILGITVLFFGKEVNGQKRWFAVGPLSFQPAEFSKIVLILCLAALAERLYHLSKSHWILLWFGIVTLPIFLPVVSANLSSGIIIFAIAGIMAFICSKKRWIFAVAAAAGAGLIILLYQSGILQKVLDAYQMDRIYAWQQPEAYASTNGFQTLQGLYAIGAGGIFGRGLGESIQKMGYLPEAQNDMIFSIICEELGLLGAALLIVMFMLLIWRFMAIASQAADFEGMMIVSGVMAHISIQVLLNIAVVTNTIPNTGISLPFISYGGSSIMFLMIEMGIVLNVASQSGRRC